MDAIFQMQRSSPSMKVMPLATMILFVVLFHDPGAGNEPQVAVPSAQSSGALAERKPKPDDLGKESVSRASNPPSASIGPHPPVTVKEEACGQAK